MALAAVNIATGVVEESDPIRDHIYHRISMALQILGGSAAANWMLNDRGPRMLEAEPEVTSAVDIFVKDLGIVLEAGRSVKAALPLAAVAHQFFLSTSGRGDGAVDDSQVIRPYHLLNGN